MEYIWLCFRGCLRDGGVGCGRCYVCKDEKFYILWGEWYEYKFDKYVD